LENVISFHNQSYLISRFVSVSPIPNPVKITSHFFGREETSMLVQQESLRRQNEGIAKLMETLQHTSDTMPLNIPPHHKQGMMTMSNTHSDEHSNSAPPFMISSNQEPQNIAPIPNQPIMTYVTSCSGPNSPSFLQSVLSSASEENFSSSTVVHGCTHGQSSYFEHAKNAARTDGSKRELFELAINETLPCFSSTATRPLAYHPWNHLNVCNASNQLLNKSGTCAFPWTPPNADTEMNTYVIAHAHDQGQDGSVSQPRFSVCSMDFENTIADIKTEFLYNECMVNSTQLKL
jgi:hypothetical protein